MAGPRLRRLRERRGLSQAALARLIAISPSYLNQIERNQRPLTVPVLLRLTAALDVDIRELSDDASSRLVADLNAVLSDPDAGIADRIGAAEIHEFAAAHPALARAVVALHRRGVAARRRVEEMAVGLGARLPDGASLPVQPYDEVLDFVYDHHNHFPEIDRAAEDLAREAGPGRDLERLIAGRRGVRVVTGRDTADRRRFDPAARTLVLSADLTPAQRAFQIAAQWAHLEHGAALDTLTRGPGLSTPESRALARTGLAHYFAGAVLLPYGDFLSAAEDLRYDIGLLADRFGVSVETICHRLSTLQRPGAAGVPFVFVRVDRAGNVSKRHSATDFHFSRVGGTCPLWNVYEAFASPGRFVTQIARMPDGRTHLWVARTVGRQTGGYGTPSVEFAVALGCDVRHAGRLVYSRGLALDDPDTATPIGPGCGLCERPACPQRAFPLIGRPLDVDTDRGRRHPYAAL